jgi:hypothetical protein
MTAELGSPQGHALPCTLSLSGTTYALSRHSPASTLISWLPSPNSSPSSSLPACQRLTHLTSQFPAQHTVTLPPVKQMIGHLQREQPSSRRKVIHFQHRHAATTSSRKKRKHILPIIEAATIRRTKCVRGAWREHPILHREGCSNITTQKSILRGGAPKQPRATAATSSTPGCGGRSIHNRTKNHGGKRNTGQQVSQSRLLI